MADNEYLQKARQGRNELWRYLLTLVVLVVFNVLVSTILLFVGMTVEGTSDLQQFGSLTYLLVAFLPFGAIILTLWAGVVFLHRRPLTSLLTAFSRLRWGNLFFSAYLWLFLSALGDLVLWLFNPGNYVWSFDPLRFLPYLLFAIILVPMQTTAEELLFRGYLTQGFGLIAARVLPLLAPTVLFALLHSWNPEVMRYGLWTMLPYYLGMGLLLGWVTLRSRGLELALGLHAANNLYAALAVTFPDSAIPSPALFTIREFNPLISVIAFFIMAAVYLLIMFLVRRRALWTGGLVLAVLLAGCGPADVSSASSDRAASKIVLNDCRLSAPGLAIQMQAKCGTLEVFENRAAGSGKKISLRVAVLPASSQNKEADPLFLLAGGPGQAATEAFLPLLSTLDRVRFKRDLVLVDQRGTGRSNRLSCPQVEDPEVALTEEDAPLEEQLAEVSACLEQLSGDPRFYTTEIAMQDLDEVRQELGYEQIDLLGVSYGTRAALAYLQLFPERVRTVTLDSVAPPGWTLGDDVAEDAQRSLELMFARCQADPGCQTAFPELESEFNKLLTDLEQYPVDVELDHPVTGEPTSVHFTRSRALVTVRMMLYNSEMLALLPVLIHTAFEGDLAPLTAQYLILSTSLSDTMSYGMYYSVVCAEDVPYYDATGDETGSVFDFPTGDVQAICERWPHGEQPETLRQEVRSDIPVLLMSGEADPVTPPENAAEAARGLTNSLEIVVRGMGHNVMYRGCLPRLIADFIEAGSLSSLDASCAQAIQPQPFFIDFVGPQP